MTKTYIIKYKVVTKFVIGEGTMKVHKCLDGIHAKAKLERYLSDRKVGFERLIVISCEEDVMSMFDGMFRDIFK